jgi:nitrous oxide reductase accessory protein NosL
MKNTPMHPGSTALLAESTRRKSGEIMRKLLPLLLIVVLLAGCGQATPAGLTDAEMATRVALVLTSMPTATGGAVVEPTKPLPTLASGTEAMTAT